MPSIKINDNKYLHYEEYGQGMPIIFIHPPGMGSKVFYYQHYLSNRIRVLLPDLSGHGESDKAEQEVSISYYANELLCFMDALNINKAVICGYSAGCLIAQHIGIYHPKRVELMILSGAYPIVDNFSAKTLHKIGMYMVKHQLNLLIKAIARSHTEDNALRETLINHMEKANKKVWYEYYQASLQYNCLEKLDTLTMPLLLMYGAKGDWTSRYLTYYKSKCKHAELFLFEKQSHQLPTKQWKPFNELITRFILNKANLKME
ncbi:alpha/beta fold hydrolase [Bacillus songklensis]|uniref:Alpha/beta fold hydrolase n=1 Tax=Bacillus songklensis TaxID=1069116 RepID=A0ABV8B012_9BACI